MKNNSVGFCIFYDWLEVFELLTKEDVCDVVMALGRYYTEGNAHIDSVSKTARPTLMMMLRQIERAKKRAQTDTDTKTEEEAETNTETKTETETEKNKETKTNTRTRSRSRSHSCSSLRTEKKSGSKSPGEKDEGEGEDIGVGVGAGEQRENIPSLSEVEDFVSENGLINTKPSQFYNYNEKRGWKINNEPISDWRTMLCKWDKKRAERFAQRKGQTAEWKHQHEPSYYEDAFMRAVERSMKKRA